jgi:hypothetical protein
MLSRVDIKTILELWESGLPKVHIAEMIGISRYSVRNCIEEYKSLEQFSKLHPSEQGSTEQIEEAVPRKYVIQGYTRGRSAYSDEDLIRAVAECKSVAKVLERFGLKPAGGNYIIIKKRIQELGLDTSHFKGSHDWARGRKSPFVRQRALEEIMVKDSVYTTSMLRKRLISEGIFEHQCMSCGLDTWMGNKIPLEIDHINGDRQDNRLENLRLLCPNCHALTATYRGKNKKAVNRE